MKLLVATKNPGKFEEIAEALRNLRGLDVFSLKDIGCTDEVEETGKNHEENAIIKARYFFEKTGLPALGEDSGLHVNAFPDELGVHTRRWGGLENVSDEQWIAYFLKRMRKIPEGVRGAKFVCFAVLIIDEKTSKKPHIFSGETAGLITSSLEAPLRPGIPLSSCFRPNGFTQVYAALTPEEKNRISHRGKAIHAVRDFLEQILL